jgi:hypothetical protein
MAMSTQLTPQISLPAPATRRTSRRTASVVEGISRLVAPVTRRYEAYVRREIAERYEHVAHAREVGVLV